MVIYFLSCTVISPRRLKHQTGNLCPTLENTCKSQSNRVDIHSETMGLKVVHIDS
jgi:hypothetical protein